jgi:hypothetical protein
MRRSIVLALAFAYHASFGSFCMMSMASAHEMPNMPQGDMADMTSADCNHCTKSPKAPHNPCAAGDCVTDVAPDATASVPLMGQLHAIALPAQQSAWPQVTRHDRIFALATAPPGDDAPTKTIVLRL